MILTANNVRSLPAPTDSQWLRFTDHLLDVHSWYKHLKLINGGEFVVFVSPDAGEGYATQYPALPYGNTVEGYRKAFGHLDYMYRFDSGDCDERWSGDGEPEPELDSEILNACRFIVYPFVSQEFYWCVHEKAVALIRNGLEHPNSEAILAAYDAESRMNECWDGLPPDVGNLVSESDESDSTILKSIPKHLKHYLERYYELEYNVGRLFIALSDPERKRIRNCVTNVRRWLEQKQGCG